MPAYAYPIKINRKREKVCFDEIKEIDSNSLTLKDLEFVGEDCFSITENKWRQSEESQFPPDGYTISVSRARPETDEEMNYRISRAESYMVEYNKRHPKKI